MWGSIKLRLQDVLHFINTDYISVKGSEVEVYSGSGTGEGTKHEGVFE
jgi:hypothetical protein